VLVKGYANAFAQGFDYSFVKVPGLHLLPFIRYSRIANAANPQSTA
jgi:hypothetical protein